MSKKNNNLASEGLGRKLISNMSPSNILKIRTILHDVHIMSNYKRIPDLNNKNRCVICHTRADVFYCIECIRYGNFYYSSMKIPDRFAQVKINEEAQRLGFQKWEDKIRLGQHNTIRINKLKEITECKKTRILLLRRAVMMERLRIKAANEEEARVQEKVDNLNVNRPKFRERLQKIGSLNDVHDTRIATKKQQCVEMDAEIRCRRSHITSDLSNYILPIVRIQNETSISLCENINDMDVERELADALETHYVGGHWIKSSHFNQVENFKIFSAILPGSGNYTDFFSNQFNNEGQDRKEAQNICAGLSHICQLVNVLANQYGVNLPTKIFFSDFNAFAKYELKEKKFQQLISKLNVNALYLCSSQGIPPEELHPQRAIPNLVKLLDGKQVLDRRNSSYNFNSALIDLAEENYEDFSDSDSDGEWENISNLSVIEATPSYIPIPQTSPYRRFGDSPSNLVSSTAASVMSVLKGIAGSPYK